MSWLFSQALVAEYLAGTCLDGAQSAPSNGNHIQQAYCAPDKMTAFSRLSRFGMTFVPLTEIRGVELLMSYLAASRARTSALRGGAQASLVNEAGYGKKWHALSARFDRATSSWKTAHCLWEEDLPLSSLTLPRWGLMRNGQLFQHQTLERPISETVSGLWPTPKAQEPGMSAKTSGRSVEKSTHLTTQVALAEGMINLQTGKIWPTPCASDGVRGGTMTPNMTGQSLSQVVNSMKFATPQSRDFRSGQQSRWDNPNRTRNLNDQIAKFPTPCATDHKGSGKTGSLRDRLDYAVERGATKSATYDLNAAGGQLNPMWVEWLMGWPLGWTDLKPLEMDKFQQWLQQHGACCADNERKNVCQ